MFEDFLETDGQREKFRSIANRLLNSCFIVKNKQGTNKESRSDYFFIMQHKKEFNDFFELLNYEVLYDEIQCVIGLKNLQGTGRIQLNKIESILLLILRVLFLQKKNDLNQQSDDIVVTMQEINDKYATLDVKNKPNLDKITEINFVRLFKRFNLIDNLDRDVNQSDARIVIYPSILMAVPVENVTSYYEKMESRLAQYKGDVVNGTESDDEEVPDETSFG